VKKIFDIWTESGLL